jgi:hypothetical protein
LDWQVYKPEAPAKVESGTEAFYMRSLFSTRRVIWGVATISLLGLTYWYSQEGSIQLSAQQGKQVIPSKSTPVANESSNRVVAYIYGTTGLSREEFGEYLIQRVGRDRIELFVNKRIIETVAAQKGIEVTPVEIDAVIEEDCRLLKIEKGDFVNSLLKRYGKTMFEWKEDVIKPRLMLTKMVRDKIQVAEEDLKKMFENRYGKKVKAQVIIWPKNDPQYLKHAQAAYESIRKSDEDFNREAKKQADGHLASREGHVDPIARYSPTGDNTIEDVAFALKPGELSRIIDTPVGAVVIKCNGHLEAQKGVDFEKVKPELLKEVLEQKISKEVPMLCEALKAEAKPVYVLQPISQKEAERQIRQEIEKIGFDVKENKLNPMSNK